MAPIAVKLMLVAPSVLVNGTTTMIGVVEPAGTVCMILVTPTLITGVFTTFRVTLTVTAVPPPAGVRVIVPEQTVGVVIPVTFALILIGVPFVPVEERVLPLV